MFNNDKSPKEAPQKAIDHLLFCTAQKGRYAVQ